MEQLSLIVNISFLTLLFVGGYTDTLYSLIVIV